LDQLGLLDNLVLSAVHIYRGRKGFTIAGDEGDGRINYERGISGALAAFQAARTIADAQIFILAELAFLQQEMRFCDEADTDTQNSLTQAVQSFNDVLRALETVRDQGYKIVEKSYPQNPKYRFRQMPKDAYHAACISHRTRIQNILRVPGMNMTEKAAYQQRFANMTAAQNSYFELQQKQLVACQELNCEC
jgi:hypothetical protein